MQENHALLREQMESMKRRMENAEHKTQDMSVLQVKYDKLKHQLDKWASPDAHGVRRPMWEQNHSSANATNYKNDKHNLFSERVNKVVVYK